MKRYAIFVFCDAAGGWTDWYCSVNSVEEAQAAIDRFVKSRRDLDLTPEGFVIQIVDFRPQELIYLAKIGPNNDYPELPFF